MAAYAAVASLLQTVDYLLKFPTLVFEIKKIQGGKFLRTLKEFSTLSSLPLRERIGLLDSTAEQYIGTLSGGKILWSFNSKLVEKKPEMLKELESLERDLTKLLDIGIDHTWEIISNHEELQQLPPFVVQKLIRVCQTIREGITFFCAVNERITVLHQHLWFLLINLDNILRKWDHHPLPQCIKDAADRTRDFIEEWMVDNQFESAITCFIEIESEKPSVKARKENVIKKFFQQKKVCRAMSKILYMNIQILNIRKNTTNINDEILSLGSSSISLWDSNNKEETVVGSDDELVRIVNGLTELLSRLETVNIVGMGGIRETTLAKKVLYQLSSISLRDSNEDNVVGFDDELISILDGFTRLSSGLEIVTIVGMGGIGKTTLAKSIFNHPYIAHHFYCRAWITISQVYQVRDLLVGLLSSVAPRTDKMSEKSNAQLAEDLYRSLKSKRYLIVLDDMWSIDGWSDVKRCFPDDKIGSRIIVTSRFTELTSYISPKKPPHFMNLLDAEKSWKLLEKLVFGIASCSPELVEVGKKIAKRCRGLPLAIVVIAGILSRTTRTPDSWKHIAEQVSSIVSSDPEQCLDILALSYIYLPHQLRACFLYMGAFPEDCEIEARKLINLWVAEGFLYSDCSKNLEQIGEECLEELIGRNLVLVEKRRFGGKVKTCRLHDFLRELCIREARKENFMSVVQRGGIKSFPSGIRNQRRLSFHLDPYINDPTAPPLPRVSSFMCFSLGSDIVPDVLFFQLGFKLLRVLDIYFLRFEYFPEQVLMLIHLRYLALNVTFELPETICQLRNLQTFIIQGPWLSWDSGTSPTLLLKYWSMPSLRHLHCSVASQLMNPSIHLKDLPGSLAPDHLQTLSTIRFSSCKKEVFAIMPRLKRLGICETKDEYSTDRSCFLLNSLIFLQELETLNCCFYVQNREPRRLSCLRAFPSTLRQLSLSLSYLPWEDITPIALLPNLEVLKLKNYAFQGPKWLSKEEGFRSLKHLLIEKTNLVYWEATVHQFPCLQNLILKSCKILEQIPFGVEEIGSLQRIELHYCSKPIEILAKEIQEQIEGVDVVIRSDQ